MKRTRIALVSDAVLPFNKGGKETRIYHVTQELTRRGFTVDIYTMQWWAGGKTYTYEDVTYHALSRFHPLYAQQRRSIWQAFCFALACLKLVAYDFDVLEVDHMPYLQLFSTKLVALIKHRPMYATWHEVWGEDYWHEYLAGTKGWLAAFVEKVSVRLPDHITAVSATTYDRLQTELNYRGSLTLAVHGIDMQHIAAISPAFQKSDVIFAGRLIAHKHVDVLIQAIALLKSQQKIIRCLIIGDGPEYEALQQLIHELKLDKQVTMLGFLESSDAVLAHIKASKLYVLPSTREGFGIAILEALACGKRIITIDHPDNAARHLVPTEAGALCALDAAAVAQAIKQELAKATQSVIPATVISEYDWRQSGQILSEVYSA
jgi:glycosyltransferase involved in cell wall biosynthesis